MVVDLGVYIGLGGGGHDRRAFTLEPFNLCTPTVGDFWCDIPYSRLELELHNTRALQAYSPVIYYDLIDTGVHFFFLCLFFFSLFSICSFLFGTKPTAKSWYVLSLFFMPALELQYFF